MSTILLGSMRVPLRAIIFAALVFVLILVFTTSTSRMQEHLSSLGYTQDDPRSPATSPKASPEDLTYPTFDYTYDNIDKTASSSHPTARDPCEDVTLADGGAKPKKVGGTKVLVTGGAGFIGSNLVDMLLDLGYTVRILDNLYTGFLRNVPLDNDKVEFLIGDILDPRVLEKAVDGVEYVYHLAAMSKVVPSVKDPEMARFCVESNALGTWNVLNAVRKQGKIKKVIYAASSTYYGNQPAPHQEDMAPDFLTPYAASKYEGELQMQMFDRLFEVPTISTRFFMVYGPRQPSTGAYAIVTGVFAKQAADGKTLTIEGDGSHYRDFIHVHDIVSGLILSQQSPDLHGNVVNLGTGSAYSVHDVADLVTQDHEHTEARKNDLEGTLADTCRMKHLLGYTTQKDFHAEMSYMVKATFEGNVFAQKWMTPLHALSAPHLLAPGSSVFNWPKQQDDLDALLLAIKNVKADERSEDREISVIPVSTTKNEGFGNSTDVLLNTIFSLVRFGSVSNYLVAVSDQAALENCTQLNIPCYDMQQSNLPSLTYDLLQRGYDIHMAQLGNSYMKPAWDHYRSLSQAQPQVDVFTANPRGDTFVRASDASRSAAQKWTGQTKKDTAYDSIFDPMTWSESFEASTSSVQQVCNGSFTSTASDSATSHLENDTDKINHNSHKNNNGNHDTHTTVGDASTPISSSNHQDTEHQDTNHEDTNHEDTTNPERFITTANKSKTPSRATTLRKGLCSSSSFYVSMQCSNKAEPLSPPMIKSQLKRASLWHLDECQDKEHCDLQQTVPLWWVAKKADLKDRGGMC